MPFHVLPFNKMSIQMFAMKVWGGGQWVNTTKRVRGGKGNNKIILISKMRSRQGPAVGKYGQGAKIHFNSP